MDNNARLGFTFQAMVCNKYDIIPETDRAINTFNSAYESNLEKDIEFLMDEVFEFLKLYLIECTTFKKKDSGNGDASYNFVLSDNSTLSIRTNLTGGMVAPVPEGKSLYKNYLDAWKKSPWDKSSCTVKENHGGTNIHPKLSRCLTPRELAALQSFPDDFIFKGSKKWQLVQIGNAVPPLMGKAIGLALLKNINQQ